VEEGEVEAGVEVVAAPGALVLVLVQVLVHGAEALGRALVVLVRGVTQETLAAIRDNNTQEVLEALGQEAQEELVEAREVQEVRGEIQEVQVVIPDSSTRQEPGDPGLTKELLWVEVDS